MATTTLVSTRQLSELVVHIDKKWSPYDFSLLFDSIERLYIYHSLKVNILDNYIRLLTNTEPDFNALMQLLGDSRETDFFQLAQYTFEEKRVEQVLRRMGDIFSPASASGLARPVRLSDNTLLFFYPVMVNRIKYGSKGSIDLLGVGKFFESIRELLFHYIPNEEARVRIQLQRKEIELKDQEIMAKKIENYKLIGLETSQIQVLLGYESLHLRNITNLIGESRILNIEIKDPKPQTE